MTLYEYRLRHGFVKKSSKCGKYECKYRLLKRPLIFMYPNNVYHLRPAVVAWFVFASTFSFSRFLHSANSGSNPAQGMDKFIWTNLSSDNSSLA